MATSLPLVAPLFPAGREPLPLGLTEEDRAQLLQGQKYQTWMSSGAESCAAKTAIAGIGGECMHRFVFITIVYSAFFVGLGISAFFSLMSTSFAYEDPYLRAQSQAGMNNTQKAREIFKDMGKGMWRSGKGFGKVGALFAGIECVIEGACCSRHPPQWVLTLSFLVLGKKRHGKSSGCRFCCRWNSCSTFGTQSHLGRWPGICSIFCRNRENCRWTNLRSAIWFCRRGLLRDHDVGAV